MELTINNTTLQITNEGGTIIIKAERGEYRADVWTEEPEEGELTAMLWDALCPVSLGIASPTYEEWLDLWCTHEEDEDDTEDREQYEQDHNAAEAWKAVSDINPDDILNYLEHGCGFQR